MRLGVYDGKLIYYMNLGFPVDKWEVQVHNKSREIRVPIRNLRIMKKQALSEFTEEVHAMEKTDSTPVTVPGEGEASMGTMEHLEMGMYLIRVRAKESGQLRCVVHANSGNITFESARQPDTEACSFLFICPADLDRVEFILENPSEETAEVSAFQMYRAEKA